MTLLPDHGSAIPPPPGVTPRPGIQSKGLQRLWLSACIVMLVVPTILVAIRLLIRYRIVRQWKLADTTCIIAWLFLVPYIGIAITLLHYGVGDDAWNLSPVEYSNFAKRINIGEIFYMPAIFFAKAAILLQLYQVFGHVKSRRWMLIGLVIFNALFFTALMFVEIFECTPRARIWNPTVPGKCINIQKTFIVTASINVADDLLMLALPIFWVWKLNISLSKRLGICSVFATGVFGCVCSIMRLAESIINLNNADITHALWPIALWSLAEVAIGVVLSCLPVLPALFRSSRAKVSKKGGRYPNSASKTVVPLGRRGKLISDESLLFSNNSVLMQPHIATLSSVVESKEGASFSEADSDHHQLVHATELPKPAILRNITIDQTSHNA